MIKQFQGIYTFLSNFFASPIKDVATGITFPTNEHYFQAKKFVDLEVQARIAKLPTPGAAKKITRLDNYHVMIRSDWYDIRLGIMLIGVTLKFKQNYDLRTMLLDTKGKHLQEGNYWGDKFWGVDLKTGEGRNNLGKILMLVRDNLEHEWNEMMGSGM
jgi:ribA/ribD-fused uncharacterized protein